jgi:uncharacterized protein
MLAWAAPVGRMAFTNYLGQSIIFGWIFYAYGLGLFGKLNVVVAFTIAVGVYAMQVVLSALCGSIGTDTARSNGCGAH